MRRVLILGATSVIARAAMRHFAADGDRLFLVGRATDKLQQAAAEAAAAGASFVATRACDLAATDEHAALVADAERELAGLDVVLMAHGALGDPATTERDYAAAAAVLRTNFLSVVSLATLVLERFRARRGGTLAVIGSIAGDCVRRHNVIYGTAKGAVALYLQGLRARCFADGIHILTIKPGFIDTPMAAADKRGVTARFFAPPEVAGRDIYRAIVRRRDILYTPWYWACIMFCFRHLPEWLAKRL